MHKKESLNRLRFLGSMSQNAKGKYSKIKKIDRAIDFNKLACSRANGKISNFIIFRRLGNLAIDLHYGDIRTKTAKDRQDEMEILPSDLNRYNPKNKTKMKEREETLDNHVNYLLDEKRLLVHLKMSYPKSGTRAPGPLVEPKT